EASVGFLNTQQPAGGATNVVGGHVLADRFQARKDLPRAVDVIDAPSPPSCAARVLFVLDVSDRAADRGMGGGETAMAEAFEHPAGDIGTARVLHGVVIGKGDLFQDRAIFGLVESGPAAVVVLHGEEPVEASGQCRG